MRARGLSIGERMISDERSPTTITDDVAADLDGALLVSSREVVTGFASLGADLANLPRTSDPLWRTSMSRHVRRRKLKQGAVPRG